MTSQASGTTMPTCPHCGAPLPMEARFCGSCGNTLPPSMGPQQVPPAAFVASPEAPVVSAQARAPVDPPAQAPAQAPAPIATPAAAAPAASTVRNANRTMIGVMMPQGALGPASAQAPAKATPSVPPPQSSPAGNPSVNPAANANAAGPMRVANAKHTMVGVTFQPPPAMGAVANAVAQNTARPGVGSSGGPVAVANANQTMVGVSLSPQNAHPNAPQAAPVAPNIGSMGGAANSPAAYGMTPIGPEQSGQNSKQNPRSPLGQAMVMPAAAIAEAMNPPKAAVQTPMSSDSADDFSVPGLRNQRKKTGGSPALTVFIALGVISVLVGGGVLLGLALRKPRSVTLQAAFERGTDGSRLLAVRVPTAAPGAKLRYLQTEYPIVNGAAQLPGSVVGDRVGQIVLPVQIISNGETTASTATVVIAYLVRPVLDGLGENPPVARLQIRVAPGAHVTLDGQPVQIDAAGTGLAIVSDVRALLATDPPVRHGYAIRVQNPNGTVADGQYAFELARTGLSLERPLARLTTSAARSVVKVRAPGASIVLFNDQPASTHEGDVFSSIVSLAPTGTTTVNIRALRAQFAPAATTVMIDRVGSDEVGVVQFAATSASPCAPLPNATRVQLRGRVLGDARPRDGGSTFQLLVQDARCPAAVSVWIDAEPDVVVRSGASLRVLGTAVGTRTSVSTTGERRTDPVLLAAIIQAGR